MSPAKKKNFLWNIVFYFVLAGICFLVWAGSKKVDYNWQWYNVPKYIVYTQEQEFNSPVAGTVRIDGEVITVEPKSTRDEPYVVKEYEISKVEAGEFVYEGDLVAVNENIKVGPLLGGLLITLQVSVFSIFFAIIIGVFTGLARISINPVLKKLAVLYIELIRGTPLLVQIFIFYFFVATILSLDRMTAGIAALSLFAGAYIAEIVRAGIQSISKGQMEAARSLGMSYTKAMMYVILPQAMKRTLPPMAGQFISLIKDSSLVSVISITDLTKAGREVVASTFSPFEVWFTVALMYLLLTSGLSLAVQKLERKMAAGD